MKYFKRLKIYKDYSGNNTFNPETLEAYSYQWWKYLAVIEGKLIFNDYRYSVTTGKHQSRLRSLLIQLGITPDIHLPVPSGLQGKTTLEEVILEAEEHLCDEISKKIIKSQENYQKQKERRLAKEAKLKEFLEEVELMKISRGERSLIVSKFEGTVTFHLSTDPDGAVKREAEYCSPNAVADICMNRLQFPLTVDEVVEISNFC